MQRRVAQRVFAAAIVLTFALTTALWLGRTGARARTDGTRPTGPSSDAVRVVRNSSELIDLWWREGRRGRRLVHASRFLHFVPVDDAAWFENLDAFPIRTFDLARRYERSVDARNLLWVLMRTGIAREVYHVLPEAVLDEKLRQVGRPVVAIDGGGRELRVWDQGSPRVLTDRFPRTPEPVLLSVDASYLESLDAIGFLDALGGSGLDYDVLVLCRSEDNPDVSEPSRRRMDTLVELLRAQR